MNEQDRDCENLPVGKNEDVEFSRGLADEEDLEAAARADAADERQEGR